MARRSLQHFGTPVDVLSLYLSLWGATLLLFAVPLIAYSMTPLVAWVGIYGAIGTGAAAGWVVAQRPADAWPEPEANAATLRDSIGRQRLRICWAATAVLGVVGMLSFIYAVSRVLPWWAVVTDPDTVREVKRDSATFQQTYGLVKLLSYFNQVAFVLWTIGLRVGAFGDRWRFGRYLGVLSILPFFLTADRGLLVATVVWAGLLQLIWPQRHASPRRVIAILAAAILAAGLVVTIVGNRYGGSIEGHPEIAEHLTTRAVDPFVIPYLYLTANIPTYGQLTIDRIAPVNGGGMTLLPLRKAFDLLGAPGTPPVGNGVFYPIPFESFSNYSWLGSYWLDFRMLGVLLLPALVVGLAAFVHRRARRNSTLSSLWITSLLLYVIVFSPFANALSATLTWQFLLLTPAIAIAIDRRLTKRLRSRFASTGPTTWIAGVAMSVLLCGAVVGAAVQLRGSTSNAGSGTAISADVMPELKEAVVKARFVYQRVGKYPGPTGLAGRLQVNRPDLTFRPQDSYAEPVPLAPGVISVFSGPKDVFLRMRSPDGRVFEVHRTEQWGGVTFGPGTRDG